MTKPKHLARAIEGAVMIDDFAYDQGGTLTCPNGLVRTITAPQPGEIFHADYTRHWPMVECPIAWLVKTTAAHAIAGP